MTIALIADIVFVVLLLLAFFTGWKKGLIIVLSGIVAIVAAYFCATPVADIATEKALDPVMEVIDTKVEESINDLYEKNGIDASQRKTLEELLKDPNLSGLVIDEDSQAEIEDALDSLGIGSLKDLFADSMEKVEETEPAVNSLDKLMKAAKNCVQQLLHIIFFIIAFLVLCLVFSIILRLIGKAIGKLPLIGKADAILGAILNTAETLLVWVAILMVLQYMDLEVLRPIFTDSVVIKAILTWDFAPILSLLPF